MTFIVKKSKTTPANISPAGELLVSDGKKHHPFTQPEALNIMIGLQWFQTRTKH